VGAGVNGQVIPPAAVGAESSLLQFLISIRGAVSADAAPQQSSADRAHVTKVTTIAISAETQNLSRSFPALKTIRSKGDARLMVEDLNISQPCVLARKSHLVAAHIDIRCAT